MYILQPPSIPDVGIVDSKSHRDPNRFGISYFWNDLFFVRKSISDIDSTIDRRLDDFFDQSISQQFSSEFATATKSMCETDFDSSTIRLDDSIFDDVPLSAESEIVVSTSAAPVDISQFRGSTTTPPIQLTSWRMRDDVFASRQSSPVAVVQENANANGSFYNGGEDSTNGENGYQRLAPEELPRLFPEWTLGVPFLYDDQSEEETKGCCGNGHTTHSTLVRWFIATISLIGLSCVVVGVVLGALTVSGSTRLTLCLLMIGVGVILITVSGLAWRLTSLESNGCLPRSANCLSSARGIGNPMQRRQNATTTGLVDRANSRVVYSRVGRRRPSGHQYFADVFQNPEFVWRPPPPTYQTAMRDRCSRNILNSRRNNDVTPATNNSPPPTYRSRHDDADRLSVMTHLFRASSRPPSYSANESAQNIQMSTFPPSTTSASDADARFDPTLFREVYNRPTRHDDRAGLVRNEAILSINENGVWTPSSNSAVGDCSEIGSNSINNDRLTIIDCSEPVPIGFELRRGRRLSFWPAGEYQRRVVDGVDSQLDDSVEGVFRQRYV